MSQQIEQIEQISTIRQKLKDKNYQLNEEDINTIISQLEREQDEEKNKKAYNLAKALQQGAKEARDASTGATNFHNNYERLDNIAKLWRKVKHVFKGSNKWSQYDREYVNLGSQYGDTLIKILTKEQKGGKKRSTRKQHKQSKHRKTNNRKTRK